MQLTRKGSRVISGYFLDIAKAFFVGGVLANLFVSENQLQSSTVVYAIVGSIMSGVYLFMAVKYAEGGDNE